MSFVVRHNVMKMRAARTDKAKNPFEQARRHLLNLLTSKYLYRDEYFKDRVAFLNPGKEEPLREPFGFTFNTKNGAPFILGVVVSDDAQESDLDEAFQYALRSETIGLLAVLPLQNDTPRFYRRRFDRPKFDEVRDFEYYFKGSVGSQGVILEEPAPYKGESSPRRIQELLPISNKLENLFFEIHSCMRDVDGLHADEALEELCKLLYVKVYDEELLERTDHEPLHVRNFGSCEEYAASVRKLYREAANYDLRVFRLKIPQYERSRGVFNQPLRLSSPALTRCFQHIENLSLTKSRSDVKGRAFQKVLGRAMRAGMGQYFTPSSLCELMVAAVQPRVGDLILDPFCGSGHFLSEALRFVAKTTPTKSKQFHEFAFGKLHGIEKSDRMVRIAMTDMRLSGDGHSNIRCTDALLDFPNYPDITPESFDIVLTNPPFGSLLGSEALNGLGRFELAHGRKNVPLEVLGLERSIQFLRPGGRLGIVLPDNILSADSYEFVRQWLPKKICLRVILSLPIETFSPYGANVKTSILFARKWRSGEIPDESAKVCLLKLESVGYDASGRITGDSDITEAVEALSQFFKKEGW